METRKQEVRHEHFWGTLVMPHEPVMQQSEVQSAPHEEEKSTRPHASSSVDAGTGKRVPDRGLNVERLGLWVRGLGFRVRGCGFRVESLGFRIWG